MNVIEIEKEVTGILPCYKGFLFTTTSGQKQELESAFDVGSKLYIAEGHSAVLINNRGQFIKTSVVDEVVRDNDFIKFWTKSGTYYCFSYSLMRR